MIKNIVFAFICVFVSVTFVFSGDDVKKDMKGTIEEVADDGTYIILDGKKILTPSKLTECQYFIVGDDVKISVKDAKSGLVAVNCQYDEEHTAAYDYDDSEVE